MGNPAGGLLLLLLGVMLLLMFVTGRLDWLFNLARDVNNARTDGYRPGPTNVPPPVGNVAPTPPASPSSPLPQWTA